MIRPQPAAWFEIVATPGGVGEVLALLAAAGCAEVEPAAGETGAGGTEAGASVCGGAIFARITGWTSDPPRLAACLQGARNPALVHFPQPPGNLLPPLFLRNPDLVRPFEIFARLVGMPGHSSADPSGLLVLVAPLLFGYMFGDVVQGAVLIALGAALQRRWPMLRLLIAGGLSAMVFGFVFGAAAGIHGLVPALWVDPLSAPLPVLLVPIAFGGVLLTIGLALNGLEAHWSGRLMEWLRCDSGFVVLYVGLLLTLVHPAGWLIAVLGLAAQVAGRLSHERKVSAGLGGVAEIAEKLVQICINTLSFVRVGAFALAHAGLSSALASMLHGVTSVAGYALLLIGGNALIIVIEVLVASIQTTRLILFEFFTKFFESTGREFRPLAATAAPLAEVTHVKSD